MKSTLASRFAFIVAVATCCSHSFAQYPLVAQQPVVQQEQVPPPFGAPGPLIAEDSPRAVAAAAGIYRLTLDEARCRVLQNSAVMEMATAQVAAKGHALDAARKDYLPK